MTKVQILNISRVNQIKWLEKVFKTHYIYIEWIRAGRKDIDTLEECIVERNYRIGVMDYGDSLNIVIL